MTEESVNYQDGDVVWVKLLYCWWPGEVISLDKVPAEVRESFKQPPLAVVRFFQEDTFEYVKSGNSKNICIYATEKKNDHIKRGMDLVRSKTKSTLMTKFPADVCTAERLTGGNPNILNEPQFAELLVPSSSSAAVKRRNSSGGSSGGTPSGRGRGRGRGRGSGRGRGGRMSTGSIVENQFFSMLPPKKTNKEIIVTHPRFINDDIDDHEVVELIQTKRPSMDSPAREDFFNCNICGFKTTRVDVLVMHREIHCQKPMKRKITSPKKLRKTYPMPRSKTKTLEEDIALVRSGKTVEDFLSDEETPRKRVKKSKLTPKEKVSKEKRSPKEHKEKKEKKTLDTLKSTQKEEIKKIDTDQLVAEWNEVEESEDEAQENESKVEEQKTDINDAIKSCFDFDEDSEEILTTEKIEGRKIPRVIPEPERSPSPKIQTVVDTEINTENVKSVLDSGDIVLEPAEANEVPTSKEKEPTEPKDTTTTTKSPATEEVDLSLEIESVLQSTSVPELPAIPQIREKCEQNFHDTRTIKFPDKTDPTPIQIDKQESNGFLGQAVSEVIPVTSVPIVVPVKSEVATKLTNPKKRFVRSFQEEKAKVQDRLDKLEKEKLEREKSQVYINDFFQNEASEIIIQRLENNVIHSEREKSPAKIEHETNVNLMSFETPKIDQPLESKVEELPDKGRKSDDEPDIKKSRRHTSKKIERKSKYKPKRRENHSILEPAQKPEVLTAVVNSFIDDEMEYHSDKNKLKTNVSPMEAQNIISDLKSNDEKEVDIPQPIFDHNEISKELVQSTIDTEITAENNLAKESTNEILSIEPVQTSSPELSIHYPQESAIQSSLELKSETTQPPTVEVSQQPAIEVPQELEVEVPQQQTFEVPQQPAVDVPQQSTVEVPQQLAVEVLQQSTVEELQQSTVEVPQQSPVEVPQQLTVEAPQDPTDEAPQDPTDEAPQQPTVEVLQEEESKDAQETIFEVQQEKTHEVPQERIFEVIQEKTHEIQQEDTLDVLQECIQESAPVEEIHKMMIDESLNQSNEIGNPDDVDIISAEKYQEAELEIDSRVGEEETTIESYPMNADDTKISLIISKGHVLDNYNTSDVITLDQEKEDSSENDCCNSLPTSLPESPRVEDVSSISNPGETETKTEQIIELELTKKIIPEVKTQPEHHTIEDSMSCSNELHEASILINTGTHNSEELSALNTLATLSEMIQPEFDVRTFRKEESLFSAFDTTKEMNQIMETSSELEEKITEPYTPENVSETIDEQVAAGIKTAMKVNEPEPKDNIDHMDIPNVIVEEVQHISQKVEVNETVPEVLDKITVFPDDQLVKGQMEIVTLNSSDPISNDSSKTDMELETINENISVITETKPAEIKSFVVHEPENVTDFKELTTENESVLEKPKTESISAIETNEKVEPFYSTDKDEVSTIENINSSTSSVDCDKLITYEDTNSPTITKTIVSDDKEKQREIQTPIQTYVAPIKNKHHSIEPLNSNFNLETRVIVSATDTLAAAIANTIESEMAKLTDTAVDITTLPIQQKETSSSKLLEILSESKSVPEKPKRSQILQHQLEIQKKQMLLNKTSFATNKPSSKAIILSDQVIKPARNDTDSVVVQKVTNKRTLEDFEDIDAYIIQKPGKKPAIKPESDIIPPAPKILKKSSPRSRPRILQQTIITAAGDVIQPDSQLQQDDQTMFDINSMPIVLSDQILTPESLESMPMILQDGPQTSKVIQSIKTSPQTVKLLNKAPNESVIKSSPKAVFRGYHKAPQRPISTVQKKGVLTTPTTQVKTNYILVPSTGSATTSSSVAVPVNRKTAIKRQGSQILLQTSKTTAATPEPTGNKIMIVTNNLGQQQRVVLTPAQHKMFMQQNSNKLKTTTTTFTTVASKIIKTNPRPNILSHPKTQLISAGSSSGQTILLTPTQMITPLTPQQMKAATKVGPTKLKVTKYVHSQPGSPHSSKTIIIRNQQGHTVKKLQANPDADLDRQVAEQIEAIKAAEAIKNSVKVNQSALPISKDPKVVKHLPVKKLIGTVKPQQQQPMQQQRKSVVKKTFSESARSLALAGTAKIPGTSSAIPPLTPLLQQTHLPNPEALLSTPTPSISSVTPDKNVPSSISPDKDGEKRQLVMQDDQGNMSAIPVGQILAIPNETIDGQAQSYVLVTMDETGNLIPINQETLMSIDPNILGNMVVQNDQVPPKTELEAPKSMEKLPSQELVDSIIPPPLPPPPEVEVPPPSPESTIPVHTTPISETPSTLLSPAEVPTNLHSTTCNINNGDVNKQVVITGDPVVTQKFLESLAGNQELFNLLANAEGNLLIHADGQQILINTTNTPVENAMMDQAESNIDDRNPVMSNPSNKNHDILAAALADTDVIPSKLPPSQLSPALYPLHSSNVLETSAMNSPIMTPLEVTETHSKKIDDILGQVPKGVSDLPITITDPNISHTVAQQQLANDIHASLELPLTIPDHHATTSVGMNSPSFSYSLPNLDEDISQKAYGQSISMPLLSDDPEEPIPTTEERTSTTDSLIETSIKLETTSSSSIITPKEEYSLVDRMCSMRSSRICSSLSEPPPDMFDYTPESTEIQDHQMLEVKGERDILLQKVTAAMKKAFDDSPNTHIDNRMLTDTGDDIALTDIATKDEDKLNDELSVTENDKLFDLPADTAEVDRVKTKEELFEPNLTPQFHSPSTNTDDSCEIPVQPPIVTALDEKLDEGDDTTKPCNDSELCDNDNKNCKMT